jgi:hypothetical protein
MPELPTIRANVIFMAAKDGGRSYPACNNNSYRPHLVVEDPGQQANHNDDKINTTENYLGVAFAGDGAQLTPGKSHEVTLILLYYLGMNYGALRPGAKFTIREGSQIVGHGEVVSGVSTENG